MGRARKRFAGPSLFPPTGSGRFAASRLFFTSFQEFVGNFPVRRPVSGGGFLCKENNLTTCRKDNFYPCPCAYLFTPFSARLSALFGRFSPAPHRISPASVSHFLSSFSEIPLFPAPTGFPSHFFEKSFFCPLTNRALLAIIQLIQIVQLVQKFAKRRRPWNTAARAENICDEIADEYESISSWAHCDRAKSCPHTRSRVRDSWASIPTQWSAPLPFWKSAGSSTPFPKRGRLCASICGPTCWRAKRRKRTLPP